MTVITTETFDLVGEAQRSARRSEQPATQSPGGLSPQFSRVTDERQIRFWTVALRGQPIEVRRLNDLWNRTRFGTLPMDWQSPDDGLVYVVFDMPDLSWLQVGAQQADLSIELREWPG